MRILFSAHRDRQHLYPMVPLAWACRAAGHEVRIASAPVLVEYILATGLPAVAVGADTQPPYQSDAAAMRLVYRQRQLPRNWPLHAELLDDEQRAAIEMLSRNAAAAAELMVDDLIRFARHWQPDLVVYDTAGLAGAVAAAALDVPSVRHLTGVSLRPMETPVGRPEPLPEFAELFERRGYRVRAAPTMTIDPTPPGMRLPVAGPWRAMRFVPYNGPGSVPSWLHEPATAPRVCITWGMSVSRSAKRLGAEGLEPLRLAVDALSGLDLEVILATTADQLAMLPRLGDNVRPVISLPLLLVLPHCAAIVHQAGDGTTSTAAALGVPQLTVPRGPGNVLTGDRLAGVGAGVNLPYQELAADPAPPRAIRSAVERLLSDPAYAEAALTLRDRMAQQPAPAELVPVLAALTQQRSTPFAEALDQPIARREPALPVDVPSAPRPVR